MKLKEKIIALDDGRFKNLVEATPGICENCEHCRFFVPTKSDYYRCHIVGSCPAATWSSELQSYIQWKIGWQTMDEHLIRINAINNSSPKPDQDIQEQFDSLWEKYGMAGLTPDAEQSIKNIVFPWYVRGRINE